MIWEYIRNIFDSILFDLSKELGENKQKGINIDKYEKELLKEFVNINREGNSENMKPLLCGVNSNNAAIVHQLILFGATITPSEHNYDGFNAIQIAIIYNNFSICQELITYIMANGQSIADYDISHNIFVLCVKFARGRILALFIKV